MNNQVEYTAFYDGLASAVGLAWPGLDKIAWLAGLREFQAPHPTAGSPESQLKSIYSLPHLFHKNLSKPFRLLTTALLAVVGLALAGLKRLKRSLVCQTEETASLRELVAI